MNKILCENYDEMSRIASDIVIKEIAKNPKCVLGLPTGSSPIGMYENLVRAHKKGLIDFSYVKTFNLDEYYKIDKNNPNSYYHFMHEKLFNHINISPANINIPDGSTDNPEEECKMYDKKLFEAGGIDLQILGLGCNGHIGFNEPDSELNCYTHIAELSEKTIIANSRFFSSTNDVPKYAITMGMGNILKARKILLLASGSDKAYVIKKLFSGKISTIVPVTFLNLHRDVTVLIDQEHINTI